MGMGDTFHCGDTEALVGFLYEECETDERAAIAAHLAVCSACAAEVGALSVTRQQLSAWTPPDARLDVRLTSKATPAPRVSWWSNPLPAWQLAAAVVIFAVGTGLGATLSRSAGTVSAVPADLTGLSHAELTRLDQRLRDIEAKSIQTVPAALDESSRQTLVNWVRREIHESELRNSVLLAERILELNEERALENMRARVGSDAAGLPGGGARFATIPSSAREE
jgi:anti-sigma factor RsiW